MIWTQKNTLRFATIWMKWKTASVQKRFESHRNTARFIIGTYLSIKSKHFSKNLILKTHVSVLWGSTPEMIVNCNGSESISCLESTNYHHISKFQYQWRLVQAMLGQIWESAKLFTCTVTSVACKSSYITCICKRTVYNVLKGMLKSFLFNQNL